MSYTDRYVRAAEAVSAAASHRAAYNDEAVLTPLEFHEEVRRVAALMDDDETPTVEPCKTDGCPEPGVTPTGYCAGHEPF